MAKKEVVTITDDLDGRDGAETVAFAYAGRRYEIDLGEKNKAKLEKALEPFIAAARKVDRGGKGTRRSPSGPVTRTRGTALDLNKVRTWATDQGLEVAKRGRIAKKVLEAFQDAPGSNQPS